MKRAALVAIVVLAAGPAAARTNTLTCTQLASFFGESFATGDFDGDGFGDLLVSSYLYDAPEFGEGVAFEFAGAPVGIPDGDENGAVSRLQSNIQHAHLGFAMDGAGDVDGDGYDDVILAIGLRVVPQVEPGYVLIYRGGPDGIGDRAIDGADTRLWNDLSGWIGDDVFGVGDVNGDGYDDVAIGVPAYDAGEGYGEGAVFLFLGGPSGHRRRQRGAGRFAAATGRRQLGIRQQPGNW